MDPDHVHGAIDGSGIVSPDLAGGEPSWACRHWLQASVCDCIAVAGIVHLAGIVSPGQLALGIHLRAGAGRGRASAEMGHTRNGAIDPESHSW